MRPRGALKNLMMGAQLTVASRKKCLKAAFRKNAVRE
jgi:hypothetical protein